jgi:hypothetical protein
MRTALFTLTMLLLLLAACNPPALEVSPTAGPVVLAVASATAVPMTMLTMIPPTTTPTMVPSTAMPTMVPPSATPTMVPPTATPTMIPPTATPTTAPPTATPIAAGDLLLEEQTVGGYTVRLWQPAPGTGMYNHATLSAAGQPDVRIESVSAIGSLPAEDITGDGFPDVLFQTYAGGSHCCWGTVVYSLASPPEKVLDIASSVGTPNTGQGTFQNLDGDGIYEFITADPLFGIPCTGPFVKVILRYEPGQGYVGASPSFPEAYVEELAADTQAAEAGREATRDGYECDVYPLIVTYLYLGQSDLAREALGRYYLGPEPDAFLARLQESVAAGRFYVPAVR